MPSPATAARTCTDKRNPLGHDYFHAIVDDHSRLAYGELLADERAATVDRVRRARPGLVRRPRHHRSAA